MTGRRLKGTRRFQIPESASELRSHLTYLKGASEFGGTLKTRLQVGITSTLGGTPQNVKGASKLILSCAYVQREHQGL